MVMGYKYYLFFCKNYANVIVVNLSKIFLKARKNPGANPGPFIICVCDAFSFYVLMIGLCL
jgi:hypothetical protein